MAASRRDAPGEEFRGGGKPDPRWGQAFTRSVIETRIRPATTSSLDGAESGTVGFAGVRASQRSSATRMLGTTSGRQRHGAAALTHRLQKRA